MRLLAALAVVLLLVPASTAQENPPIAGLPLDMQTLRQTEEDFARAFVERNVARFAGFVAADARFTSAGKIREGKAAILEQWNRMMQDPNLTLTWSPDIVEVSQAGDLGFTSGPYEVAVKLKDGTIGRQRGRFASIWRRQSNGSYQIIFDIGSPEEPTSPPRKP